MHNVTENDINYSRPQVHLIINTTILWSDVSGALNTPELDLRAAARGTG